MKNLIKSFFVSLFLVVIFALSIQETNAQGCVMCKAQVGESKDQDEAKLVGTSLNTGILYLMLAPYLLIGTVGFIWYRNNKKKAV
jgi:hypothetical protein